MSAGPVASALVSLAAAAGADAALVSCGVGEAALTRFAGSHVHQSTVEELRPVSLTVCVQGRVATVTGSGHDVEQLHHLARSAVDAARTMPVDPGWPGVAGPEEPGAGKRSVQTGAASSKPGLRERPAVTRTASSESGSHERWAAATAAADPAARVAVVAELVAAAREVDPRADAAGLCSTLAEERAVATSAGLLRVGRWTSASVETVVRVIGPVAGLGGGLAAPADGSARRSSADLAELDGAELGRSAASLARSLVLGPKVAPGRYPVVLGPQAVSTVLGFLALHGFNGRPMAEGRSALRLGGPGLDAALRLVDHALDPRQVGLGFDPEGTLRRRLVLSEGGLVTAATHDRRTALAAGSASTGHFGADWGPVAGAAAEALVLEPTGTSVPVDQLVAGLDLGLVITDLWYTRVLDPRTLVVTGLSRNGTFWVERGEVVGAVPGVRFTQSFAAALAPGAVQAVGSDGRLVAGSWAPSLLLSSWNVTG